MIHKPVLVKEVLEGLQIKPDDNIVDGTVGQGGHTLEFLKKNMPNGKVLGIDWDEKQIENSREQLKEFSERIILVNDSYANISEIIQQENFKPVNGMLVDLGYSSWQIEGNGKGFSFLKNEPLDMRYGMGELTAREIVNEWSESEIERIAREYGEEKFSKRIAHHIIEARRKKKIETTFDLKEIVEEVVGRREKIHPATRMFQALRIAVNGELENVQKFLPKAIEVLSPGGRLAVISFHSLEDRIVKHFFKEEAEKNIINIITNKPVVASSEEITQNPRSRSAKLRVIVKL